MSLKLSLLCCFIVSSTGERSPRLAGGSDAKLGQFPYQVNLYDNFTIDNDFPIAYGGGAILNERWILTAAYNIFSVSSPHDIVVKAANIHPRERSELEQTVKVAATFVHPKYADSLGPNDIALIKLETPLEFNEYVQPIDLPQPNSQPSGSGVIAGLGSLRRITNARLAETLQTLTLPIISNDECRKLVHAALGDLEGVDFFGDDVAFCTGPTETNQGYCLDDTGNALVTEENGKKVVSGVATFAFAADCTTPDAPSIYTRVSAFNDWIQETMSKN